MSEVPADPTTSVMRLRLCGSAVLTACVLVLSGCGGGSDSGSTVQGEPISFEQLAQSASTSSDATSGRFAFDMSMTFPGTDEPFALSGEGAFDASSKRSSLALDMSSLAKLLGGFVSGLAGPNAGDLPDFDDPAGWKIEVVQDGDVGYVRFPALDGQLPEGKTWIRGADGVSAGGFDFEELDQFTSSDPREVLDALREVTSEVETVGAETLRGAGTTHYRAIVDPAELAKAKDREGRQASQSLIDQLTGQAGLGDIPLDVWIDGNGMVRKLSMAFEAREPGASQSSEVSLAFELWDYGESVDIELPPAAQVANASELKG